MGRTKTKTAEAEDAGADPTTQIVESDGTVRLNPSEGEIARHAGVLYRFPTWWGGQAASTEPPLIHGKLIELRRSMGGLEARRQNGLNFAVKSAKDLGIKLREGLDRAGLNCAVVGQDVTLIPTEKGTACHVKALVRVSAADGSYQDFVGSGHGMDRDDKAGGKASTYAWKDALVKGLNLPDAQMVDTDDEAGVGADVVPRAPQGPGLPDPYEMISQLEAVSKAGDVEGYGRLLEDIKTKARASGPGGMQWATALTPAVQAAKARLGL